MGYRGRSGYKIKPLRVCFSIKTNIFFEIKQIIFLFVSAPKIKNNKNKNIRLSDKIYILNNFIMI